VGQVFNLPFCCERLSSTNDRSIFTNDLRSTQEADTNERPVSNQWLITD
jgi:hypothetical protein